MIDYELVFSKRRTVTLTVNTEGKLIVRAPRRMSQSSVHRLVETKRIWIEKSLKKIKASPPKKITEGEVFLFLGRKCPLRINDRYSGRLVFENGIFYLPGHKTSQGKKLFAAWYAKQAKKIIFPRAAHFAGLMGVCYKKISITSARTRWGSCGSHGTVNFSWRLVMAPLAIIDSVVVHELAHLIHHNHSRAFWDKVREFYPHCESAKKWLKEHGHLLRI